MREGKINIQIPFPIILLVETEVSVVQTLKDYLVCKKSYIPILRNLEETLIDSQGNLYKRVGVSPLGFINVLAGFRFKYAGFGVCYVAKEIEKLGLISGEELKKKGEQIIKHKKGFYNETTLEIERWKAEFDMLRDREDILRYLFYFASPSHYNNPDIRDERWRSRRRL